MTRVVIANTVDNARSIDRSLIPSAFATSVRAISQYGAGRGILATEVLVDDSAYPLPDEVQELLDIWTALGARVHRRTTADALKAPGAHHN